MCLREKEVHHQTVQTLVLSLMLSALGEACQESHRHYPSHQHLLPFQMAQAGNFISYIEIYSLLVLCSATPFMLWETKGH